MKAVVELKNVTKIIRGRKIIDDLSFEVEAGEVFGFLGPNGAGKTTTIRMIVGLIGITAGEIKICGKSVRKNYEDAISHVGAIVENPELYKFLTGYQNLQQSARLFKGITKEKIDAVVSLVGLTERIHDKVKTYSLGMRQRLGIAQSLLHDPKVLILDEPTNGLDPAGIREIRGYLRRLAKEKNLSIIVSSHLLSEMEMMCDRFAIIQKGTLVNVQSIASEEVESDTKTYYCDVDNRNEALKLLASRGIQGMKRENGIHILVEPSQIPDVLRLLLEHDLLVFEISPVKKSLEERFLEMTNDPGVAANV
ncbi:ABC transporter ATP-binding protein [Siminovitchia sp. FSL H7-0308]|uniref:ABC-2 type transport system ATP-binding protein n=1 Tax=Siminovitchia thermophila TaxID=1245522 RepID=A0ABS2R0C4_9BACI|nr:ABC transporter ATP-binding protein [Siminovitchia thermophila]MBM7713082.1 ABC-2 type transport system ATP-binding protein [Siminovitchia thermophila]ONK24879.1 bacitracin ABC transporter ATP-binding protein [Bacillus sp. VT-16-64]